ncbi:MAG TPA: hypothetical protein VIY73_11535 [Polyangiaceae bacterium]
MRHLAAIVAAALLVAACGSHKRYPANSCHSDADCDTNGGFVCYSEATSPSLSCDVGCGCCGRGPDSGNCHVDSDCQAADPAAICEKDGCCGSLVCTHGCTDDSTCGAGSVCTEHRCVAAPCQSDSDCPSSFACSGTCARRLCTSDSDCPGYCLDGACYDDLGSCTLAPD